MVIAALMKKHHKQTTNHQSSKRYVQMNEVDLKIFLTFKNMTE